MGDKIQKEMNGVQQLLREMRRMGILALGERAKRPSPNFVKSSEHTEIQLATKGTRLCRRNRLGLQKGLEHLRDLRAPLLADT